MIERFNETVLGQSMPTLYARVSGISRRTFQDGGPKSPKAQERVSTGLLEWVEENLVANGMTSEQVREFVNGHPANKDRYALYEGLVYNFMIPGAIEFPATRSFARQLDLASQELIDAHVSKDLDGSKEIITSTPAVKEIWSVFNDETSTSRDKTFADAVANADSFDELGNLLKELAVHALFAVFARWDIEFSDWYFRSSGGATFALVLPKLDPKWQVKNGGKPPRKYFWLPEQRLIDLLAILGQRIRTGRWPEAVPQVKEIAGFAGYDESTVVNWRRGRKKLSLRQMVDLYRGLFTLTQGEHGAIPEGPPPAPIFAAALMWSTFFTDTRKSRSKTVWIVEEEYLRWWRYQKTKHGAKEQDDAPWPQCLNLI